MSQEILEKLNSIAQQVVKNGTMIVELKDDTKELKDGQAWIIERLSSIGALQYQLNDYGKRIDTLEMKVSRAKSKRQKNSERYPPDGGCFYFWPNFFRLRIRGAGSASSTFRMPRYSSGRF